MRSDTRKGVSSHECPRGGERNPPVASFPSFGTGASPGARINFPRDRILVKYKLIYIYFFLVEILTVASFPSFGTGLERTGSGSLLVRYTHTS